MSFTPKTWADGNVVASADMTRIEAGIMAAAAIADSATSSVAAVQTQQTNLAASAASVDDLLTAVKIGTQGNAGGASPTYTSSQYDALMIAPFPLQITGCVLLFENFNKAVDPTNYYAWHLRKNLKGPGVSTFICSMGTNIHPVVVGQPWDLTTAANWSQPAAQMSAGEPLFLYSQFNGAPGPMPMPFLCVLRYRPL